MHIKFRIGFEDGTFGESHDHMWNKVFDHANFLPPNCDKKWIEYSLITDEPIPRFVTVNFLNGLFRINNAFIHPAIDDGEIMTHKEDPQDFPVTDSWSVFNGYNYFPVVGRRNFKGFEVDATLYFCGWKRKEGDRTIQKLAFIYPNGQIALT